jgi:enoyl-CoA hydratase
MDRLDDDRSLVAGVITGAGGTFCAGMDLKAFLAGERPSTAERGFAGIVEKPPLKPIVAALEGYAIAGGFEIALACDMLVAAEDAKIRPPRGQAGPGRRGRRAAPAPQAGAVPPRDGVGPDGRADPGAARLRGRPGQPDHAEGRRASTRH